MRINLCQAFPALDPVKLLDYPLVDVLDLIREMLAYNRRHRTEDPAPAPTAPRGAGREQVIYRPAGDEWF